MSDSIQPNQNSDQFFSFFVLLFLAVCLCYCCRNEELGDDPAHDPIIGYIPNPSSTPTPSLEEKRNHIEENLILRKVVEAEIPGSVRDNTDDNDEEKKKPMMGRMVQSERTFGSYFSALTRASSARRNLTTKFSEPINPRSYRQSQSLPASFPEGEEEDEEQGGSNVEITEQGVNEDEEEKQKDDDQPGDDSSPSSSIKHRRKCDIVARTLATTLGKTQDEDAPTTCDICLMDYEVGEEVAWSHNEGCVHAFHKECITDWLLRNPKCPICRRDYIVEGQQGNDGGS